MLEGKNKNKEKRAIRSREVCPKQWRMLSPSNQYWNERLNDVNYLLSFNSDQKSISSHILTCSLKIIEFFSIPIERNTNIYIYGCRWKFFSFFFFLLSSLMEVNRVRGVCLCCLFEQRSPALIVVVVVAVVVVDVVVVAQKKRRREEK